MGNTVTCCVSPDASPKPGRARAGAGGAAGPEGRADAYQVAASAAEAESGDSDPGGGGGSHLQHISDREFPDGERRAGEPGERGRSCREGPRAAAAAAVSAAGSGGGGSRPVPQGLAGDSPAVRAPWFEAGAATLTRPGFPPWFSTTTLSGVRAKSLCCACPRGKPGCHCLLRTGSR